MAECINQEETEESILERLSELGIRRTWRYRQPVYTFFAEPHHGSHSGLSNVLTTEALLMTTQAIEGILVDSQRFAEDYVLKRNMGINNFTKYADYMFEVIDPAISHKLYGYFTASTREKGENKFFKTITSFREKLLHLCDVAGFVR